MGKARHRSVASTSSDGFRLSGSWSVRRATSHLWWCFDTAPDELVRITLNSTSVGSRSVLL